MRKLSREGEKRDFSFEAHAQGHVNKFGQGIYY